MSNKLPVFKNIEAQPLIKDIAFAKIKESILTHRDLARQPFRPVRNIIPHPDIWIRSTRRASGALPGPGHRSGNRHRAGHRAADRPAARAGCRRLFAIGSNGHLTRLKRAKISGSLVTEHRYRKGGECQSSETAPINWHPTLIDHSHWKEDYYEV